MDISNRRHTRMYEYEQSADVPMNHRKVVLRIISEEYYTCWLGTRVLNRGTRLGPGCTKVLYVT